MHTPALSRIFALTGLCAVVLLASACAGKCPNPCNADTVGNVCQKDCDGPYDFECVDDEGTYSCGMSAPCDEAQHCSPLPECYDTSCSFSKCSYSKSERSEGLYKCNNTACCLSVPSVAGTACTNGTCDGAGNCNPT